MGQARARGEGGGGETDEPQIELADLFALARRKFEIKAPSHIYRGKVFVLSTILKNGDLILHEENGSGKELRVSPEVLLRLIGEDTDTLQAAQDQIAAHVAGAAAGAVGA